jgi:hypothetical protein
MHAARATCGAILRRDGGAGCNTLASRADQARCVRDGERWRSFVLARGENEGDGGPSIPTAGMLHLEPVPAGPPFESDSAFDVTRGTVLVVRRDGIRLVVGALTEDPSFLASSLLAGLSFAVEIVVVPGKKEARIEHGELVVPGHPRLVVPPAHSTLVATVATLERERGGEVSFSIDGEIGDASATWRLHARVATFVRDVVTGAALYDIGGTQTSFGGGGAPPTNPAGGAAAPATPPFGANDGMR